MERLPRAVWGAHEGSKEMKTTETANGRNEEKPTFPPRPLHWAPQSDYSTKAPKSRQKLKSLLTTFCSSWPGQPWWGPGSIFSLTKCFRVPQSGPGVLIGPNLSGGPISLASVWFRQIYAKPLVSERGGEICRGF